MQKDFIPTEGKKRSGAFLRSPDKQKPGWRLWLAAGLGAACIAAAVGIFLARDQLGGTIQEGVTVGPIAVGGMTRGEAKKALKQGYALFREDGTLTVSLAKRSTKRLDLSDCQLQLGKQDLGLQPDLGQAVKDAWAVGRKDGADTEALPITPYLHPDTDAIRNAVSAFGADLENRYQESSWQLEGAEPDVTAPDFNENSPCQTLILNPGRPGIRIDEEALCTQILNALERNQTLVPYSGPMDISSPPLPDLEGISQAVCKAPAEPSIDRATLTLVPGVPGYGFDMEEAKAELPHVPFGQTLSVALRPVFPETADEDVYFQDVLGHCETPYSNNPKREVNLKLACKALDGLVLQPGQDFSYNETLGERTAEKGYQPAPAYSGTTLVDSLGGGICQVSSTLYLASVYAELTVTERRNHGFPVHYIPYGMDATVNWGFTDLKLRNDMELPVKIHAEASDGTVRIEILGLETRDYDIKMSYSVGGRHVKTYKSKYDKQTGELISKDFVALSSYLEDVYPS